MMATTDHGRSRRPKYSMHSSEQTVPTLPIHIAIVNKDLQKLKELVHSGETQLHPVTRETPLHAAARCGSLECLRWLLSNHVNSAFDKDCDGSTPGHYSAAYGQLAALKELLASESKRKHELAKCVDENGLTVLSLATLQSDLPMVSWLLENFSEMGRIKDTNGDLPVHFAAAGGSLDIMKLYIQKFGRKYAEESDSKNIRPVYFAAQNGKLDVLQYLLLEVKVDSKVREKGGMTIMHAAVTGHQIAIVKWLVSHLGPKTILSRSYDGATPLHIAAAQGFTDLLEYFIENLEDLSDINVRDDILATPAHDAAEFGELNSLLILLKHGADISIKDKENKTAFDLAVEKKHSEMMAMITDYRESGPRGLEKYDKTLLQSHSDSAAGDASSHDLLHRTSQISNVKLEASNLMERRKDELRNRKASLQKLNYDDEDSGDELERQLMNPGKSRKTSGSGSIPHTLSPEGDIYALVSKKPSSKPSDMHTRQNDQSSDVESQTSSLQHQSKLTNGFGDPGASYRGHHNNVETASNFSRPSRVKYYNDNDSMTSVGSSVSQRLESGRHHMPGYNHGMNHSVMPPRVPKGMMAQPPMPPNGYPYPNYQYPFVSTMVAQHYGIPYQQAQYMQNKPKTIGERMHMEALQKSGHALYGPPTGFGYPPMPYKQPMGPYPRRQKKMRPSSGHSSNRSMPVKKHVHSQNREIGFGPLSVNDDSAAKSSALQGNHKQHDEFHPPPPPITKKGMANDQKELQSVDENFIMVQADTEGKIPTQASEGTKLHRATVPGVYDGRYDQYIMTDSEDEPILDEHISVTTLAECALLLALGPICGLIGLKNVRKEEPKEQISPAVFAEMEAQKTSKQWGSQDKMNQMPEIEVKLDSPKAQPTLEDWTKVLGVDSNSLNTSSMVGQQLGGSIRARHFAMNQLKQSTLHQSLASLAKDDQEDDDIISVVVGDTVSKSKHRKKGSRTKSSKKCKENSENEPKKTKKRMIVKPSKPKEQQQSEPKPSGPIEVHNTAFDSSDSEKEKKKRKKNRKKDKKDKTEQNEEVELDAILTKTQKDIDEIADLYPKDDPSKALEKIDQMFPQNTTKKDSEVDEELAKFQQVWATKNQNLTPQQETRMQFLQSIFAGNDKKLKKRISGLFSEGWNPIQDVPQNSSATNITAQIEKKIMESQEKHREETEKHLKSQAAKSESMQMRLEGEMKKYMEAIQKEFEDQKQLWKEEIEMQKMLLKKEKNKKKKKKNKHHSTSYSEDSETDSVELVTPKLLPSRNAAKPKANIEKQKPLEWQDFNDVADKIVLPPEPPPLQILLSEVNDPELKQRLFRPTRPQRYSKRSTSTDLIQTEDAVVNFMGESSDEEYVTNPPKVATRKRADIQSSRQF